MNEFNPSLLSILRLSKALQFFFANKISPAGNNTKVLNVALYTHQLMKQLEKVTFYDKYDKIWFEAFVIFYKSFQFSI